MWLKIAMIAAVTAVFGLAYLDSAREETRTLGDFTAEETMLARTFAVTIATRVAHRSYQRPDALFDGVPSSGSLKVPMTWIVMDPAHRWIERRGVASGWRSDGGDAPGVAELLTEMERGGEGALFLDRPTA